MKMICQRCRSSILSRLPHQSFASPLNASRRVQLRNYSDGKPSVASTPPPPKPRQPIGDDVSIPSAISSASPGISQPLSTPEGIHVDVSPTKATKSAERPPSSCPPTSVLNGLNYFKNKPEVVAMEDSEYPEWLWGLLDTGKKEAKTGGVDPSSMSEFLNVLKC